MPPAPPSVPLWLDLASERLWCVDQALALRPKTFALLRYLVEHPGQLLTKAALLEALWPETLVSEVVLAVCLRELRQMLEQQLERLSPLDQRVLEVGSVAGATFSAAAVAAGLAHEVVEVEDWCAGLTRRYQWLEACGEQRWPDGTVAEGYRFRHALYQEVAYQRLPAARRVQLHRCIGERAEAGYGPQVRERGAALAPGTAAPRSGALAPCLGRGVRSTSPCSWMSDIS